MRTLTGNRRSPAHDKRPEQENRHGTGMLTELELGPTAATGANSDQLALRKKMVQWLVTGRPGAR